MPRWPAPQVEALESPPAPPAPPPPEVPKFNYQPLDPEGAENRTYPYNGETVIVSASPDEPGFTAKWRATRKMEGWRWVKTGKWVTPSLNFPIHFDPLYWRPFSNLEHL